MTQPTLTPDDLPMGQLGNLAQTLRDQAEQIGQHARERLAANDMAGAVARYEAALARFQAAVVVEQRATQFAARVAELHGRRAEREHRWPLPELENLTATHRDPGPAMGEDWDQRFPRWGVQVDAGTDAGETYLSITPASHPPASLHERAPLLLRLTQGRDGYPDEQPDSSLSMWISADQWQALNALAERIQDRVVVPYDEQGNARFQPEKNR